MIGTANLPGKYQTVSDALPAGWKWLRLGEHASKIGSGITPRGGSDSYLKQGIPLIRSQNVHMSRFEPSGLAFISDEQDAAMAGSRVCPGDVLLNITGASIGRVCVVPPESCPANVNQHVSIIRCNGEIDSDYLAYYLAQRDFQKSILDSQAGATRQALTKELIQNFRIAAPALAEQKRIAGILKEQLAAVDRARAAAEAQLDAANALPVAYLRSVFDGSQVSKWPNRKLGAIARLQRGKFTPRPRTDPRYFGGPHPWIQIGNVEGAGMYVTTRMGSLNDLGLSVSKKFPAGTLVVSIAATVGALGILSFDACMPDSLVGITPIDGQADTEFLYFLLTFVRSHLESIAPQMAQANLSVALLEGLVLPIPDAGLQRTIAAAFKERFAVSDRLRTKIQSQLNVIDAMPAALLRSAFQGRL